MIAKKHFLVIFLIVTGILNIKVVFSQNIKIEGIAKGAEGKTILLKKYNDNLTQSELLLATSKIDSNGNFELKCNFYNTGLVIVHIEYYLGEMYLEPNHDYTVEIKNLVFNDKLDKINHYLEPSVCYIKVISENSHELNRLIYKLNYNYNLFFRKNAVLIRKSEIYAKIDTFMVDIKDTFQGINHSFFNDYITYRIASLKFVSGYSDPQKLMADYIVNKPILYDNIEYITFFSDLFDNYFKDITRNVQLNDLLVPVYKNKSYFEALDVLGKDTLLRNEVLRELVLIKTLMVLYSTENNNKKAVLEVLQQISVRSKFEKHRQIATNLITFYMRFDKGIPAFDFALPNTNESIVRLTDLRGKMVYACFFTTWCRSCIDEMDLMEKIYDKYKDRVVFISISADRELIKSFYLQRDKKYNWEFLHFNNDYDLLEKYSVYSYPSFVLIDKEGKIIQCPAPKPSDNIEMTFKLLLNPPK